MSHSSTTQMMTCTRCLAVSERTPYVSGACAWPCNLTDRPAARRYIEHVLLRPASDFELPGRRIAAPGRTEPRRSALSSHRQVSAPARSR
ncbi:hypothetical protein [Kitasatospora cineracea]|uniref:hypothetical protein n=1 Tax=Kitasatospora cineracea TaxID=88074 RepID=UPI0033E1392F